MKLLPANFVWGLLFLIAGIYPAAIKAQTQIIPLAGIDFKSEPASALYGELTVRESGAGSAYVACGFTHGWLGVQELPLIKVKKTDNLKVPCRLKSHYLL